MFLRPLPPSALMLSVLMALSLSGEGTALGASGKIALAELDLTQVRQGWGEPVVDRSVVGKPISIAGKQYERGLGSHATMVLHVSLDGRVRRFSALVGVDDETEGRGTIRFLVYADGKKLFDGGVQKGGDPARPLDVDLAGKRHLVLLASAAGDDIHYDHADWAEAVFEYDGAPPRAVAAPAEEKVILTPRPGPAPRIHGPKVYGARPGNPFLYRIPATGRRPMAFTARGLPASLRLDARTGIISGDTPRRAAEHVVTLGARNERGSAERDLTIVVGPTLALTPPMGWNSWYIHYHRVTEGHMRRAADAMVASGMADFGYQYVNIDDCWMKKRGQEPLRGEDGAMLPNEKFPDIRGMVDHIHSLGLKAGLYTSPGPWTCAGYAGSYEHEEVDARQYAEWGFDFLKYDWCSYGGVAGGRDRAALMRPYTKMGRILQRLDRDILLNLCQYGMGSVWEWGGEVGGHCWRTTGDLGLAATFYDIGLSNARHAEWAKPGQWNDPDYILIGWVGDAHRLGEGTPTSLTPNEQYSYMSMWCLMAAPLVFSGDMEKLDDFTLGILCNAEVIEVDQDPLGRQGRIARQTEEELVLVKPLEDGSVAVGLFNLGEFERTISVPASELGVESGTGLKVRDLWRQRDVGVLGAALEAKVARHGVWMVRLSARDGALDDDREERS